MNKHNCNQSKISKNEINKILELVFFHETPKMFAICVFQIRYTQPFGFYNLIFSKNISNDAKSLNLSGTIDQIFRTRYVIVPVPQRRV